MLTIDTTAQAEELAKVLAQMKQILQGTHGMPLRPNTSSSTGRLFGGVTQDPTETEANPEQMYQIVTGIIEEDLLYQLAVNLWRLPFEARKDTQVVFSYVFRFRPASASQKSDPVALSWVVNNRPQVLIELCKAYDHKESATPAGSVLREVLKNEAAAAIILYDDGEEQGSSAKGMMGIDQDRQQSGNGVFWKFFDWIDKSSFEVAADAFTTFRVSRPESGYVVKMSHLLTTE